MQNTNRNSNQPVESDSETQAAPQPQPAWAPPQAPGNAFFDDQRTVFQRVTHEAQTSPEDDADDVFSAPLGADDEQATRHVDPSARYAAAAEESTSSVDDETTRLAIGDWRLPNNSGEERAETFGPPGAALSELHDEGLGATMHGSQAFASFPAQEDASDAQETTMLPPAESQQQSAAGQIAADAALAANVNMQGQPEEPDDAQETALTPQQAQQYPESYDQATQQVPPNLQTQYPGANEHSDNFQQPQSAEFPAYVSPEQPSYSDHPSYADQPGYSDQQAHQEADQLAHQQSYVAGQQAYPEQQPQVDEQATYMQHPYSEPQQAFEAVQQFPPAQGTEYSEFPAGYAPEQTPFDPSHGGASLQPPAEYNAYPEQTHYQEYSGYPPGAQQQPVEPGSGQQYPPTPQQHYSSSSESQSQQAAAQYAEPQPPHADYTQAQPPMGPQQEFELPQYTEPLAEAAQFGAAELNAAEPNGAEFNAAGFNATELSAAQPRSSYGVPQNIPGRFVPTAEEFAARRAHRPQTPEATMGLPGLVKRLTFGIFAPPMSKKEEEHREFITTVRRNFGGLRQITVVNPKGGAGKTVASLMTAMTFGQNRGGYVLAWDNNETQGTLGMRAQPDFHSHTVRDVLQSLDTFLGPGGKVGDLSSFVRSQGEAMFDVLASDESATAGEMLTAAAFKHIREVVSRFYKLIIVDTGNNVRAENWQSAIDQTDQLVVTMSARGDSAETAARMLDHLEQTGRSSLVRHAVTVVSMPPSRRGLDLPAIERHFLARTRSVLIAPYEPIIDSGEPIRYESISNASKEAWLRIASSVAEGL